MIRRLLSALTLSLAAMICVAQPAPVEPSTYTGEPTTALLTQWLSDGDPRLAAWGAFFAARDHHPEMLDALTTATLRAESKTGQPAAIQARSRVLSSLLDALIQLDGHLSPEALTTLDPFFVTQKYLLLSHLPWDEAQATWEQLYDPKHGRQDDRVATRLAAEMLARHPPAGFATRLLASVVVAATITVTDPSRPTGMGVVGGSTSCCGGGVSRQGTDWPVTPLYALYEPNKLQKRPIPNNATLLLAGPDPIYTVRGLLNKPPMMPCGEWVRPIDDAIRSHLIGTLLGGVPASPFPETPLQLDIKLNDREAYRAQVVVLVEAQQRNFDQIAHTLTMRGLMTESERQQLTLAMHLTLVDLRQQPAADLPAIAFRPPVVWTDR